MKERIVFSGVHLMSSAESKSIATRDGTAGPGRPRGSTAFVPKVLVSPETTGNIAELYNEFLAKPFGLSA